MPKHNPRRYQRDDNLQCKYPGGTCPSTRALKTNGERHRLCELHRRVANAAQRKFATKKKKQKKKHVGGASDSERPTASSSSSGSEDQGTGLASPRQWDEAESAAPTTKADLQCTSSGCLAPRVTKSTGQLHRFCLRHRDNARGDQHKYSKPNGKKQQRVVDAPSEVPTAGPLRVLNSNVHFGLQSPWRGGLLREDHSSLARGDNALKNFNVELLDGDDDTDLGSGPFEILDNNVSDEKANALLVVAFPAWFHVFANDVIADLAEECTGL